MMPGMVLKFPDKRQETGGGPGIATLGKASCFLTHSLYPPSGGQHESFDVPWRALGERR